MTNLNQWMTESTTTFTHPDDNTKHNRHRSKSKLNTAKASKLKFKIDQINKYINKNPWKLEGYDLPI